MRKLLGKVAGIVVAVAVMFAPVAVGLTPVLVGFAPVMMAETVKATEVLPDQDGTSGGGIDSKPQVEDESGEGSGNSTMNPPETTILPNDMDIMGILKLILSILVYGLGVAAVLGTVIAAIMYLTARDNEQQVATAKKRLYEVVIGLVAWAVMFALLQWLIPGGLNF